MKLTLPDDPTVDTLEDEVRRAIGRHWMHRAAAEFAVSETFVALKPRLRDVGAIDPVMALVDKAIDDEARHSDFCVRLAARYFGSDPGERERRAATLPDFGTGHEPSEVALLILGTCAVNESIASSWLRACFQRASASTARFANKAHLADEIDHARLGWAHLASTAISDDVRTVLKRMAHRVVDVNVEEWRRADAHLPESGVPSHGHLSQREHIEAIEAALRDVVWPGLAHLGLVAPTTSLP